MECVEMRLTLKTMILPMAAIAIGVLTICCMMYFMCRKKVKKSIYDV